VTQAGESRNPQLRRAAGYYQGLFRAMGSPCELLVDTNDEKLARKLLQLVAAEAWRIEDKFSRYLPGNIIARINESDGQAVTVDDETANLLDFSATLYELSERRFDITSGVLRKVWIFDGSDRAAARISPVTACPCLINFGGDLVATGDVRQPDGWQVGIEAPDSEGSAKKLIALRTGALATSGDARRFLLKDGIRYGHILNPQTGWPIENAPDSVTVAADTCTQAGMLTTLAMLNGANAEAFLEQQNVQFWCLRQKSESSRSRL
jgi:FAD:protein FMN transferase